MQPSGLIGEAGPRLAVIDHHPPEGGYRAEFLDVRPGYGSVATMATEYLRATDAGRIGPLLATALLHGIRTDTDSLSRAVSPDDVQAYAFLQGLADLALLRRIEKPTYSLEVARAYGRALADVRAADGIVLAHAGELEQDATHLLPEIADFCLAIETATLAVATGYVGDELVFTLRFAGRDERDAGAVARAIAAQGGRGGGHASMARATLPRDRAEARFGRAGEEPSERLLGYVRELTREEAGAGEALSRRS
jgi:nanoRNase/pAp phosphatase (c-di-AMP/oligoRNAs hydrolase)